jgi:hypothetical protein
VHALGPYRIDAGGLELRAEVTEAAVREGSLVVVEPSATGAVDPAPGRVPGL